MGVLETDDKTNGTPSAAAARAAARSLVAVHQGTAQDDAVHERGGLFPQI
jgi:hypothetical protein